MTTSQTRRIDWDAVEYSIRTAILDFEKEEAKHMEWAARKELTRYEYLGALLTRSVQSAIDFTFQEKYDWKAVHTILSAVYRDYETGSNQNWLDNARRGKQSIRDYVCAKLTRYVAEVVDFESYMTANGA